MKESNMNKERYYSKQTWFLGVLLVAESGSMAEIVYFEKSKMEYTVWRVKIKKNNDII